MPGIEGFSDGAAITPNDSTDLTNPTQAIFVGGAGTLRVTSVKGTVINFSAVPAGATINIRAKRVHQTGTSATGIVGLR